MTAGKTQKPKRVDSKEQIYFTRAYRRLPLPPFWHTVLLVLFVLLIWFVLFWFRSELSYWIAWMSWRVAIASGAEAQIAGVDFMWTTIYCVDTLAIYPSRWLSFISFVLCAIALLALPFIKKLPAPANYWFFYIILVQFVSSLFFIFFSAYFPYTIMDYTSLYSKVCLVVWLLIPILCGLAAAAYPTRLIYKGAFILVTIIYSLAFGILRGAVQMLLLEFGTVLMMAFCFFVIGALLDFIYITSFFGYFMSMVAKDIKKGQLVWKWLY
jgi:hypothetical protein